MAERFHDPIMQQVIKRSIRASMAEENITYKQLSQSLLGKGVIQSESTLRTKISTGVMSASLLMHLLDVLQVDALPIKQIMTKYGQLKKNSTD
ncbi:MAG: DUF6471 domain-containing protein [Pseudomonadota bacterium]